MSGHAWTSEQVQFLIDTHSTLSLAQQAQALNLSENTVRWKRSALVQAGVLSTSQRKINRLYTADDKDQIVGMLQDGWSIRAIAKKLGRTTHSLQNFCTDQGISTTEVRSREVARVYTAKEIARMFGVDYRVVAAWIEEKHLKARRDGTKGTCTAKRVPYWRITDESLLAFMGKRELWPTWEVENVADSDLRAYAAELRLQAGGHWVSFTDIAKQYYYTQSAVRLWHYKGYFAGMRVMQCRRLWYVWSADLAGFVPPLERQTRKAA